jgi:hypothetical protein
MAGLTGQHSDLAAMVGIVGYEVGEKAGRIGLEAFDFTVAVQGEVQSVSYFPT